MMQSDDDVGKIATVTPVLVAKALELMMEHVLHDAAQVAKHRHTRTVTPQHLRQCVLDNEAFDFLRPTLAHVKMEATESGGRGRRRGGYGGGRGRKRVRSTTLETGVKRGKSMEEEREMDQQPRQESNAKSALESLSRLPALKLPSQTSAAADIGVVATPAPHIEEKPKHEAEEDDEDYDEEGADDDMIPDPAADADGGRTSGRVSVHALLS